MDYSQFCDDEFDMKKWVNTALQSEQNPNTLVMKLQLLMQEVNSSLEETTSSLLSDIPRVLTEIQALNNEAVLLRNQMNLVRSDIDKVQQETVESMSSVVRMDEIKERILSSERKLKQADNWCVLNEHIDQLFEEQDMEAISLKLSEMREALAALTNLPDYEARSDRLNNLSNKLEAMLSPKLISALNNQKSGDAARYYKIFNDMGRRDELYNYYYRTHRTNMIKAYSTLRGSDTLDVWLQQFYSRLLELLHSEMSWTSSIFEDHVNVVLSLVTQCLHGVELQNDVSNFLTDSAKPVLALQSIAGIMIRFASSVSTCLGDNEEVIDQLSRAIIAPYSSHLIGISDKMKSTLLRDIHALPIRLRKTSSDSLSELQNSMKGVVSQVRQYVPLCLELTNGNTLIDVTAAIDFYFDLLVEKINTLIRDFRGAFGVEQGTQALLQEDHWVGFQSCFRFLQILGECYLNIEALESEMIGLIKEHSPKEPLVLKNLNIWRDADKVKHTTNSALLQSLREGTTKTLFEKSLALFQKPINNCNKLCVDFVLSHVKSTIHGVHVCPEWVSEEGAVFTPSPLTYITTLGDYLLLLPQQLEPFFSEENIPLDTALRTVDFTSFPGMADDVEGDAFAWLTCICQSSMFALVEMILRIPRLSAAGCKQLSADVAYISNVMAALEVPLSRDISDISRLLGLPLDRIDSEDTKDIPKYLCGKISAMRRAAI